ncbi:hypothetical protein MF672_037190 [Actinomadura sp. ATCC 31491]|uniref:DUF2269 domain-containing protein n=1 Tax=Actinomadura luzonensis TaxID=2805427 RepID=A0ABT0G4S5_9ACTN|nr:hypothetical protein [Actinomadura luzonensis]MCK2219393.1 hypothetical protein [Actinomadura luzonensis]
MSPSWRHLLVWLHVVTSVAWMSQALALFALNLHSALTGDLAGYRMAELLDGGLLAHFANASAFTGIMLAAMTRWGFFRYWWVLVKFVITLVQLYAGIFLLGPRLAELASGARTADPPLLGGTLLMASAIAFQAWLSVAKPWRRTRWADRRPPAGRAATVEPPRWLLPYVLAVPVLDFVLGAVVLGHPAPLFFAVTAIAYPIWRGRALRRRAAATA